MTHFKQLHSDSCNPGANELEANQISFLALKTAIFNF